MIGLPKNRAEATLSRSRIYHTGKKCKNGHVTYRYVQSGTCAACVRGNVSPSGNSLQKRQVRAELLTVRVRLFDKNLAEFFNIAWAFAVMRHSFLQRNDIISKLLPKDIGYGTSLYAVKCFPEDMASIKEAALMLFNSNNNRIDGVDARAKALRIADTFEEPDEAPPPMLFK